MKFSQKAFLLSIFVFIVLLTAVVESFSNDTPNSSNTLSPKVLVEMNGQLVLPSYGTVTGIWYYSTDEKGSQLLLLGHPQGGITQKPFYKIIADLDAHQTIRLLIPAPAESDPTTFSCRVQQKGDFSGMAEGTVTVEWQKTDLAEFPIALSFATDSKCGSLIVDRFEQNTVQQNSPPQKTPLSLDPQRRSVTLEAVEDSPSLRPLLVEALIEWDWMSQDGIQTPSEPRSWRQAIEKRIPQGNHLLDDLAESDVPQFGSLQSKWQIVQERFTALRETSDADEAWEPLWREMHQVKRDMLLAHPIFDKKPILFAKHPSTIMSHQLTQVYGYAARPGGGLYLLEKPGESMQTQLLTASLPTGSYMHPEVSYDGNRIYFAFCEGATTPKTWRDPETMERFYHLYSMNADGSELQQLTEGSFDDFSPCLLPDGDLLFVSTRRGGFHRCGGGPCYVYTLAKMKGDGSDPHPLSFHETNEWNPAVTNDGRIVYTRWDYVDRDAVFYQNLWSTRPDGTDVRIFYGNNTFNPCGIWESKAVPGSNKVMAVGAPHHGISAGSLILLDTTQGVDGPEPVTRITPDVLYPEGEVALPWTPMLPFLSDFDTPLEKSWNVAHRSDRPAPRITELPEEAKRWPVHCFKSPWPLSEKYFIASYSFDRLVGEAGANIPNQFGIYYGDAAGNRELIYRDPNISSVWAVPLAARPKPPLYQSTLPLEPSATGRFFLQNVYESWPSKLPDRVYSLRIVQVLPKTTPHANVPRVGQANASPGKQVLGTVPVSSDGSAYFEVPAKTPLLFQALDAKGQMIQGMRSLVYLQPGEVASCTGCHEDRMSSSPVISSLASKQNEPSPLRPGPDGSKPLSFPLLVQPVLDRLCVSCHHDEKAEGKVNLTHSPEGEFSKAYNALVRYVRYSAWGLPNGNDEPMTLPDCFGARGSQLTSLLEKGHYDCSLTDEDWERLNTWMDANALFYGTFNVEDQKKQLRGERIAGPDLQ